MPISKLHAATISSNLRQIPPSGKRVFFYVEEGTGPGLRRTLHVFKKDTADIRVNNFATLAQVNTQLKRKWLGKDPEFGSNSRLGVGTVSKQPGGTYAFDLQLKKAGMTAMMLTTGLRSLKTSVNLRLDRFEVDDSRAVEADTVTAAPKKRLSKDQRLNRIKNLAGKVDQLDRAGCADLKQQIKKLLMDHPGELSDLERTGLNAINRLVSRREVQLKRKQETERSTQPDRLGIPSHIRSNLNQMLDAAILIATPAAWAAVRPELLAELREANKKLPPTGRMDEATLAAPPPERLRRSAKNAFKAFYDTFSKKYSGHRFKVQQVVWEKELGAHLQTTKALHAGMIAYHKAVTFKRLGDAAEEVTLSDRAARDFLKNDCGSSWEEAKRRLLGVHPPDTARMWQLCLFRKRYVDAVLDNLRRGSDNKLLAKSVGSQNLSSDYDITLSSIDGSGVELQAVKDFNAEIKLAFGRQPGTVFDTNLYVKDFLPVEDTILAPRVVDEWSVAEVRGFLDSDRSDQDVAALTKMRQYMSAREWDNYLQSMLDDESLGVGKRKELQLQFEEADSLYVLKLRSEVERCLKLYKQRGLKNREIDEMLTRREARARNLEKASLQMETARGMMDTDEVEGKKLLKKAQALQKMEIKGEQHDLETLSKRFHHELGDLHLEARNELYLEQMQEVQALRIRQRGFARIGSDLPQSQWAAHLNAADRQALAKFVQKDVQDTGRIPLGRVREWARSKADALAEEIRTLTARGNFFAAEAYLSEGPLQHIVNGNQSGNPEVFARLRPEHFLESINEQFGDFLKDMGHPHEDDADAYIATSKYLARMFEGVDKLESKIGGPLGLSALNVRTASQVSGLIKDRLRSIRDGKDRWAIAPLEDKRVAARAAAQEIYGVNSAAQLKQYVVRLNSELNVAVRKRQDLSFRSGRDQQRELNTLRDPSSSD